MHHEQMARNRLPALDRVALTTIAAATILFGLQSDSRAHGTVGTLGIQYAPDGCIAPSTADFAAVLSLESQPANPSIVLDYVGVGKGTGDPHPNAQAYRQEVAQQNGVTIYDGQPIITKLLQDEYQSGNTLSYKVYLDAAHAFMAQYGVEVTLATADTDLEYGRPLTAAELATPNFKMTLVNMIDGYSNVPVEYIKLAGLKHIVLAADMTKDGAAAYTSVAAPHDTDYFDATLGITPATFGHELGHNFDGAACGRGGASDDVAFGKLNGGDTNLYSGQTFDSHTPNLQDYSAASLAVFIEAQHEAANGNAVKACKLIMDQTAKAGAVLSVSEYHPNMPEAKAEILSLIYQPGEYGELLDPQFPVLKAQAELELARIYAADPGVAIYLLRTSRRPIHAGGTNCATGGILPGNTTIPADDPAKNLQK